jgi:hypothetical protein
MAEKIETAADLAGLDDAALRHGAHPAGEGASHGSARFREKNRSRSAHRPELRSRTPTLRCTRQVGVTRSQNELFSSQTSAGLEPST